MTNYRDLTKAEAEAALREFLDERESALRLLKERLAGDGLEPARLLDGTPESLAPLWRWLLSRLTSADAPGATDPMSVQRSAWPSWERYTTEQELVLSLESLTLLDGLVSYLAAVVRSNAPPARWEIARHRVKRYQFNNHPVLVSGKGDVHHFLPELAAVDARAALLGVRESPHDTMAMYAREIIQQLNEAEGTPAKPPASEPLVEVEDLRNQPGEYDFEIGLSDELAHTRSADVDELVHALLREDGVKEVLREDRDMILVRAPSWSTDALETWILRRV
jgi:hypothetical protein